MSQDKLLGYEPREQFVPFHMRTQRWACLVAHRRAGKTVACLMDLLDAAMLCDKQDGRFAFISPTYAQAKDSVWMYLKRFTADIPGVEQRESDLMVVLPNGARVRLYGSDSYDRLRGIFLDGCILDEYADMAPQAWPEVIRPALSDRRGWAVFIGTPRGRNDFWRIHENATHDPQWFTAVLRASETGLLPEDELNDLRKMLTPEQYSQELECSFDAAILGAYYGKDIALIEAMGRIGDVPHDPVLKVYTAWDLGIGDSTAIWFFQIVGGDIHVIDFYEAHGHGLPHYAAVLHAKPYTYERHYVPHDAKARDLGTGRTRVETMKTLLGRWPDVLAQNDIMDGINAVRLTLPRCRFDAIRCADGLEALRQYRADFNDKTKAFTDRPRHDWTSHCFHGETSVLTRHGTCRMMDLPRNGEVLTPCGWKAYRNPRITLKNARLVEVVFGDGTSVRCTPDHLFWTVSGWTSASDLQTGSLIQSCLTHSRSTSMAASIACGQVRSTWRAVASGYTAMFGRQRSGLSRANATFTTAITTRSTTPWPTWNAKTVPSICRVPGPPQTRLSLGSSTRLRGSTLPSGTLQRKAAFGTAAMQSALRAGPSGRVWTALATTAARCFPSWFGRTHTLNGSAALTARPLTIASVRSLNERADVWDITVPGVECFALANGAVVHNSADAMRYLAMAWRIIAPAPPPPVPKFDFGISGVPGMPFRTGVSVTELIRRAERKANAED